MEDYQKTTIDTYNKIAMQYQLTREGAAPILEIDKFVNLVVGTKILDAGTGPGRDAALLTKKGCKVVGIDLSEEFVKLATGLVPHAAFMLMDILNIQFTDNYFDGVWSCAVLSHFKKRDIFKALSELNRVLKPGGILFLAVKAGVGEKVILEEEFSGYPRFFSYYLDTDVKKYLENLNHELIECYKYNERERFGHKYRDTNFIFTFSRKRA